MLHVFLDFRNVYLEVLIPLKLVLNCDDIFSVANLPVMNSLEILLELIELRPQFLPLRLDARQFSLSISIGSDCKFPLHFF